jgi:hypothetical protein
MLSSWLRFRLHFNWEIQKQDWTRRLILCFCILAILDIHQSYHSSILVYLTFTMKNSIRENCESRAWWISAQAFPNPQSLSDLHGGGYAFYLTYLISKLFSIPNASWSSWDYLNLPYLSLPGVDFSYNVKLSTILCRSCAVVFHTSFQW